MLDQGNGIWYSASSCPSSPISKETDISLLAKPALTPQFSEEVHLVMLSEE